VDLCKRRQGKSRRIFLSDETPGRRVARTSKFVFMDQRQHSAYQGFSVTPGTCETCGRHLTTVNRDPRGNIWSSCPNEQMVLSGTA